MPSKVFVVASNKPETDFITNPVIHFNPPIKKPPIPLYWAPFTV
jgi:hypothetical protein